VQYQATLEWLPQESIFFDGSDASLRMEVDLATDARFLGWEILCFGRTARGERFDHGRVSQLVRVRRHGRILWHERGDIAGGGRLLTSPIGLAGCTVVGTLFVAGSSAVPPEVCERCRTAGQLCAPGDRVGLSAVGTLTVARYLGDSAERARAALLAIWSTLRPAVVGSPAVTPRIWST
jgi:urease accessory protein